MPFCPKCGEEVSPEMKICPRCSIALGATTQPPSTKVGERGLKVPDILGFLSAGVILIIFALTYIGNPIEPSVIIDYFEGMGNQGTFIKPPLVLLDAAIFFLYAIGAWGIVLSGLRIIFQRSIRKSLEDLIGGFFSFFLAFLLTNYATDAFTGRTTLAYFVISIGLLIIVNAITHIAFPEK